MAHDGLLPAIFARIHPRTKTPWVSTIIIGNISSSTYECLALYVGIVCAIFAAIFPLGVLGEMTSIGTLVAFFLVHISVIIVSLSRSIVSFF
jgi:APA family basic amino acid/polyamine antiporter